LELCSNHRKADLIRAGWHHKGGQHFLVDGILSKNRLPLFSPSIKKWTTLPLGKDHIGFFPDWPFGFQKSMTSLVQDSLTDPKDVFLFIMCLILTVLHVPACLYLTASVSQLRLSRLPKDKSVVGFPLLAIS
jgi:hypothetical protein